MSAGDKRVECTATLEAGGEGGAWVVLPVPFDVERTFGTKARGGRQGHAERVPVPHVGLPGRRGGHTLMVNKAMQAGAKAGPGDLVQVVMELDTASRTVAVPADLRKALAGNARAKAAFAKLASSRKKQQVDRSEEAKRRDTRAGRVKKVLTMLAGGRGAGG